MEILVFPFKSDTSLIFNKNSWYNGNFSLFKKYIYDLPVCFWCIFEQGKIFTTFENHKNTIFINYNFSTKYICVSHLNMTH